MQIDSPFIQHIHHCKVMMRKLRKKIYKYTSTHPQQNKPKLRMNYIIKLLEKRNVPEFLASALKKRKILQVRNINNVVVGNGPDLHCVKSMVKQQQAEITILFENHKDRFEDKVYRKGKESENAQNIKKETVMDQKEKKQFGNEFQDLNIFFAMSEDLYQSQEWLQF